MIYITFPELQDVRYIVIPAKSILLLLTIAIDRKLKSI